MNKRISSVSLAIGAAFVGSMAISQAAQASSFSLTDLDAGYQVVGEEGKAAEGHCGEAKGEHEGKCGEAKCGEGKKEEGKCGEGKKEEGKCGEGKCGEGKKEG